jgi:DHA1 family inner membrane transport protein
MTAPHGNFDSVPDLTRSSPNSSSEGDAATARDRAADRRALLALGVGSFGIGTGEFVIMGLLPDAARDLAITIPEAGHLISAYALGVVIGAPLLAVLGARWPRRNLLIALMSVFALGNFASALAPGICRCSPCACSQDFRMAPTSAWPHWWRRVWWRASAARRPSAWSCSG